MTRWIVSLLLVTVLAPANAQAAKLYVVDYIQVGVRQQPANNSTVMETIRTGASVTVLNESTDKQWVRVRTQAGSEGWVLARYFMITPPAAQTLSEMPADQTEFIANLHQESLNLQSKLEEANTKFNQLQNKYDKLYADSQNVTDLRARHDELQVSMEAQTSRLQELEAQNQSLNFTSNVVWFLAGGSVLLVGWLIGWVFGKRKRSGWSSRGLRY